MKRPPLYIIYSIADSADGEIRYIGKTMRPHTRFVQHVYDAKVSKRNLPVQKWIKSILDKGSRPIFTILQACESFSSMSQSEIKWIANAREHNRLLNLTDGGEGTTGYKVSDSFRKKMSEIHKGKTVSREWRESASIRMKGRKLTPEHCLKIREGLSRPEVREKIRTMARLRMTPEVRAKISDKMKVRVFTEKHRANLRASMKKRMESPEWKKEVEALRQRRIASAA